MLQPTELYQVMSGWPPEGPNFLRWEEGRLLFRYKEIEDQSCMPTDDAWEQLWATCDEIDVWSWPAWVGSDQVMMDGLQFNLRLEHASRRVESSGQLADQPPDVCDKVMQLHRAIQQLTGWHPK